VPTELKSTMITTGRASMAWAASSIQLRKEFKVYLMPGCGALQKPSLNAT